MGPRKMPDLKKLFEGLSIISEDETFTINTDANTVMLCGKLLEGSLVYRIGAQ